ncbi:cob(I)yrinic acid a,c-diamide adenosyltransferase [Candidatus Woesearchaeota archaeon]|nr:cob(I)yrinic acid a,c-diamide adenosyltransferase [Candidatus Woesearchaeota archaeon]
MQSPKEFVAEQLRETRVIPQGERHGLIIIYTGDGAGKTSAALGRAVRAAGHGHRAVVIQFLKGRNTGEYLAAGKLYEMHQFGFEHFIDLRRPAQEDKDRCAQGLAFAAKVLDEAPELLVLDEVNLVCHYGLIDTAEVARLLRAKAKRTCVILTGRKAPQELVEMADIATELRDMKPRGQYALTAQKGIEF